MDSKGQLMGVPIKLVMALVIGTMAMGVLMQFVGTAERTVLRDMKVICNPNSNNLTIEVRDAQSNDPLYGATIVVKYPGGMYAKTLSGSGYTHTFMNIPLGSSGVVVVNLQVTRNGYIPWEGQVAVGG